MVEAGRHESFPIASSLMSLQTYMCDTIMSRFVVPPNFIYNVTEVLRYVRAREKLTLDPSVGQARAPVSGRCFVPRRRGLVSQ